MSNREFAQGMIEATKYLRERRAVAEAFWPLAAKALAERHKRVWVDYLELYGFEEVEQVFIDQYQSQVQTRRRSETDFLDWVEERVHADEPLSEWIWVSGMCF